MDIFSVLNSFKKVCSSTRPSFKTKGEDNLVLGSGSYVGYPSTMP